MFCKSFGMELATLDTKEEELHILNRLYNQNNRGWIWIGGVDFNSLNEYYWTKTGELIRKDITWKPSDPNDRNHHCLALMPHDNFYRLIDEHCTSTRYPLCMKVINRSCADTHGKSQEPTDEYNFDIHI